MSFDWKDAVRQGDVFLVPIDELPDDTEPVKSKPGHVVLAEGEATGHAHVVRSRHARLVRHRRDTGRTEWNPPVFEERELLVVEQESLLEHEEHDPISVPVGVYEVRRQREYAPEAPRWVRD